VSLEIKTVKDSDLIGKDAWTLYHLLSEAESLGWRISSFLIVLERETPAPPVVISQAVPTKISLGTKRAKRKGLWRPGDDDPTR